MTLTQLSLALCIVLGVIDYKFNNGRLVDALWYQATQWGAWLEAEFSSVASRLAGR